jgi:hypothetical protein
MPNGRPGDHPLIDVVEHRLDTFSARADGLIRDLNKHLTGAQLWSFLYCLYREGNELKLAGARGAMPIERFEAMLQLILNAVIGRQTTDIDAMLLEQRASLEESLNRV